MLAEQGGMDVPAGARCAHHPEQGAVAICERCGNFVCDACVDVVPGGQTYCLRCAPARVVLAGRMARLGAHLIDVASFSLPALIIGVVVVALAHMAKDVEFGVLGGIWAVNAAFALGIDIYLLNRYGQSIGKRQMGIMIVSRDGSKVPVGVIVGLRNVLPMVLSRVPVLGLFFASMDLLFIFREDRRCLHDHMAGTRVVRAPPGFEW